MPFKLPRRLPLYAFSAILTTLFLLNAIERIELPLIQNLERHLYDQRLRLTTPNTQDQRIVIVDLDEKSLAQEGRWPWSRAKMALLANMLFDFYRVRLVGFDIVFAERDESACLLDERKPGMAYDRLFAESLAHRPAVLGYVIREDENASTGKLPAPILMSQSLPAALNALPEISRYTGNLPELQEAAMGGGFFVNPLLDEDGIFRRIPMLARQGSALHPALSLAMLHALLDRSPIRLKYNQLGQNELMEIGIENFRIPVDEKSGALIPYLGKQGSFRYLSATDVLNAKADPELLRDKIVLVGTTAAGLLDMRSTPLQNVYPGVEVHANLLAGMLDQTIKAQPTYAKDLEFAQILAVSLMLTLLIPRLSAGLGTLASFSVFLLLAGSNLLAWTAGNIAINGGAPIVLLFMLYASNMFFGYVLETRNKKRLSEQFGQYVPAELVEEMSLQGSDFGVSGENREMTVLFSDVRGFTTISEWLAPNELAQLMNHFLTPLTRVIHEHKGTIDKYMGDAIMAFWGAPLRDEKHGLHGIQAALGMIQAVNNLQEEFAARGWPAIKIGVGLNTGTMSVGNMGSEFRMAYTVLGDAVNLGSRLEALTKQYGVDIIVSETSKASTPEYAYRELDRVKVKGKLEAVAIYEPLMPVSELPETVAQELAQHHAALQAYRGQNWDKAAQQFSELAQAHHESLLYRIYLERIAHFMQHPPGEDWDGAFTFQTK